MTAGIVPQAGPRERAAMDALAAHVIDRAAPLRFRVARSAADREAVHRLRFATAVEKGWARPEDFPDGLERDAHDDGAVFIAVWDGTALAAAGRVVLPAAGRPLPIEEAFEISVRPAGGAVEIGRICVAPAYRNDGQRVLQALLGKTWLEARAAGYSNICGIIRPAVARMYATWGLEVARLGAPRPYCGRERLPVVVRLAESVYALRQGVGRPRSRVA